MQARYDRLIRSGQPGLAKAPNSMVQAGPLSFAIRSKTKSLFYLVTLLSFTLVLLSGCASQREALNLREMAVPITPPLNSDGAVFCADGAGDFRISSSQLRKVVYEDCVPLHVIPFVWSHGYGRIVADQSDQCNIRCQGMRLAEEVLAYHQEHPHLPITLYGHSAGCNVVLSALENLPPGVVERAFLLSAAISNCYDLRPALKAVNQGIYVYYSKRDCFYLAVAMRMLGRTSRDCRTAAGKVAFRICVQEPEDWSLYAKLYQRGWSPDDAAFGNRGNHFGSYQPDFIRAYILPILLGGEPSFPPAVYLQSP